MLRLELRKGRTAKLWELEVDGTQVEIRHGKRGGRIQVEHKSLESIRAAQAMAYAKLASRRAKGYVEVARSSWRPLDPSEDPAFPTAPTLEAALERDLEQRDAWLVYADWLAGCDAHVGERLALELELDPKAPLAERSPRLAELRSSGRARWYGPELARMIARDDFPWMVRCQLRHGFIVGIELSSAGLDTSMWGGPSVDQVLAALLRAPCARFLRRLQVHVDPVPCEARLTACLHALREHGRLASLRHLSINSDERWPIDEAIGELDWLFLRAPRLRQLTLAGRDIQLSRAIEHSALEHLRLDTLALPRESLRALARAQLPACERLILSLGPCADATEHMLDALAPLLEGKGFPALHELELWDTDIGDSLVSALLEAPLLGQLRVLGLPETNLSDVGAEVLIRERERLAGLTKLRLGGNMMISRRLRGDLNRLRGSSRTPKIDNYHRSRPLGEAPVQERVPRRWYGPAPRLP